MSSLQKIDGSTLTGVSETALMTLQVRASEARRPDGIIEDPVAVELVDRIDFDFAKFGYSRRPDMAMRALAFDRATLAYLRDHPEATVVALAEGLQTSFYRISASDVGTRCRWLTDDLPPMIEVRSKLLPPADRVSVCAQSALDYSWMDQVDATKGVFITAEGLLMYLQPEESLGLIAECAKRFPGGRMMFDSPPALFARLVGRGMRTSLRYRVPPMPFTLSASQAARLVDTIPGIRQVHDVESPATRSRVLNAIMRTAQRFSLFDPVRPAMTLLEFG